MHVAILYISNQYIYSNFRLENNNLFRFHIPHKFHILYVAIYIAINFRLEDNNLFGIQSTYQIQI